MPRRNRLIRVAVVLLVPLLLTGCFRARALEKIAEDISWQFPEADFHREFSISLGSMAIGLARLACSFSDETREARQYMTGIKRVQVAVYKVKHLPSVEDAEMPERLSDMIDDDWEVVIKTSEPDERVWILYREDGKRVSDMHVTVLDEDELVLLRVSGDLDKLLDQALENHHELTAAIDDARR
jgi:hypothetical protein